jgi:hypothetical protein
MVTVKDGSIYVEIPDFPTSDQLIATAVQFLLDGEDYDAASILFSCILEMRPSSEYMDRSGSGWSLSVAIVVYAPRLAYDVLAQQADTPAKNAIRRALDALAPDHTYVNDVRVRARPNTNLPHNWREELEQAVRSRGVNNQGIIFNPASAIMWQGLRFRSQSEVKIAQEFERRNVLFFPNCKGYLMKDDGPGSEEPDFLVCKDGKWGILEVDGKPFHPPQRTAQEHKRDRWFKMYGVMPIEHFDANECYETPKSVVDRFLVVLKNS